MQLINDIQNTWKRKFKVKDRLSFSLILMVFMAIYYYSRYTKQHVPFEDYQVEVYVILFILLSFVLIDFWGDFVLRIWLTIAATIGKIFNTVLFFILYFLILVPILGTRRIFDRKKKTTQTNWSTKMYINTDYLKMG